MVGNIGRELAEIERVMGRCRGDGVAEARLTGSWMAHVLISSKELLHNLLIDTARRPGFLTPPSRQQRSNAMGLTTVNAAQKAAGQCSLPLQ